MNGIVGAVYILVGIFVALSNGYMLTGPFTLISLLFQLISFFLAVLLWPAVMLGVNLHLVGI